MIEILLKLAGIRRDQQTTTKLQINIFKPLRGVLEASPDQLKKIKGVAKANIFELKILQSIARLLAATIIPAWHISVCCSYMVMIDYVITFPTANLDQGGETGSKGLLIY